MMTLTSAIDFPNKAELEKANFKGTIWNFKVDWNTREKHNAVISKRELSIPESVFPFLSSYHILHSSKTSLSKPEIADHSVV